MIENKKENFKKGFGFLKSETGIKITKAIMAPEDWVKNKPRMRMGNASKKSLWFLIPRKKVVIMPKASAMASWFGELKNKVTRLSKVFKWKN